MRIELVGVRPLAGGRVTGRRERVEGAGAIAAQRINPRFGIRARKQPPQLPLSDRMGAPHLPVKVDPACPSGPTHPLRALVVDDDPGVCATLEQMLDQLGYSARSVPSIPEFHEIWRTQRPDLLIIDLFLGGESGLDALLGIEADPVVGVIMTSGSGPRLLGSAGQSAEAHGFSVWGELAKPFRLACLRSILSAAPQTHAPVRERVKPPGGEASAWRAPMDRAFIAAAIHDRVLRAAFQPQVHAATGKLLGFEALARWDHPLLGEMSPATFLPAIAATGLQTVLDLAMLEQSCNLLARAPDRDLRISVNITSDVGGDPAFRQRASEIVDAHGLNPGRITLEVTEVGLVEQPQAAIDGLIDLHMAGFCLSIDDFGVGQSSLVRLMKVPFAELKIDRSIVMRAMVSAEGRAIVQTLTDLGRRLGLTVVAEGVEDAAAASILCALGCTVLQGYLFGKAMPADKALTYSAFFPVEAAADI